MTLRDTTQVQQHARGEISRFIAERGKGTTCPSEVARLLAAAYGAGDAWRDYMPIVHAAVDELHAKRQVRLSWKSNVLKERRGPYRIGK
jgi:hypothetical protein